MQQYAEDAEPAPVKYDEGVWSGGGMNCYPNAQFSGGEQRMEPYWPQQKPVFAPGGPVRGYGAPPPGNEQQLGYPAPQAPFPVGSYSHSTPQPGPPAMIPGPRPQVPFAGGAAGGSYLPSRSPSYSHNLPDRVISVQDNDHQRRGQLPQLPLDQDMLRAWTEGSRRLVQFSVEDMPTYHATWAAADKLDWCVWTVPRISGVALLSADYLSSGHGGIPAAQAENVLQLLFRTDRVQTVHLLNAQHAASLIQFLREEVGDNDCATSRMYLYLGCLPDFIEANLNCKAAFINAAALSLYQKTLSAPKRLQGPPP